MWPNPQEAADLVTFTEEILHRKVHFLCNSEKRRRFFQYQLLQKKNINNKKLLFLTNIDELKNLKSL